MAPTNVHSTNLNSSLSNVPGNALPFLEAISSHQDRFLHPSEDLHAATLALAKHYLDPVALTVSTLQLERLTLLRKNRKRKRGKQQPDEVPLKLKAVALEGFDSQQIWEQVNRITEAVDAEVRTLFVEKDDGENGAEHANGQLDLGDEVDVSSEESESEDDEDQINDMEEIETDADDVDMEDFNDDDENIVQEESEEASSTDQHVQPIRKDKFGLNDDFFSIEDFNRRTEMLEQQDADGQPDADAASDEEDVDWDIDPASFELEQTKKTSRLRNTNVEAEDEEVDEEDDEDGPTFGNMDLYAPEGASDEDEDDDEEEEVDGEGFNSNDLKYDDFFEPPAGKVKKGKEKASSSKPNKKQHTNGEEAESEEDIERTMAAVHRDLYSDESDIEEDDEIGVAPDASTHEKRKAAIMAQIRELEASNVAKRPWTLSGEAVAKDRPVNALLEEDLDFERTGKPLPVITAETSEEIEQLVKRRILAGEFDEVRRRRPDEALLSGQRRGRLDEDNLENQPKRGLAEVYEEEHLRKTDPAYVDKKTEKLNKEHAEIEGLWRDISSKLDSLASWRYRPKPTEISVSVRSDAPAMTMEDARPSGAGGDVGSLAQLAPQEVYKPGEIKEKGKIVTSGGTVVDRAELSQENRKRQRRREKERIKKAQGQSNGDTQRNEKQNKAKVMAGDLKKGGVKVINRKGELRDVEGNEVKDGPRIHGSSLKL